MIKMIAVHMNETLVVTTGNGLMSSVVLNRWMIMFLRPWMKHGVGCLKKKKKTQMSLLYLFICI